MQHYLFLFSLALFVYSSLCVVSLSFDVCRNALSSSGWLVFGVPLIDSISCLLEWKRALSWHIFPGCKTSQYSGHPVGKEIGGCVVEMKWWWYFFLQVSRVLTWNELLMPCWRWDPASSSFGCPLQRAQMCCRDFLGLVLGDLHLNLSIAPTSTEEVGRRGPPLTNDASVGRCVRRLGRSLLVCPHPRGMSQNPSGWPQQAALSPDLVLQGSGSVIGWKTSFAVAIWTWTDRRQEPSLCPKLLFPAEN